MSLVMKTEVKMASHDSINRGEIFLTKSLVGWVRIRVGRKLTKPCEEIYEFCDGTILGLLIKCVCAISLAKLREYPKKKKYMEENAKLVIEALTTKGLADSVGKWWLFT